MADGRGQSNEVKVALIGAAATVLVAVIAAGVAIATTRGGDDASSATPTPTSSSSSPSPAQTLPGSTPESSTTPAGKVTVDATGARIHEPLRVVDGVNIDFDGGKPLKIKQAIGLPNQGEDFGVFARYATGGYDAGVTTVPTDQPLGRTTCSSASGYAEGVSTEIVLGIALCVRTTEGAYVLLVPTSVPRRSDTVLAFAFDLYAW